MRNGILGTAVALVAGAGFAVAQPAAPRQQLVLPPLASLGIVDAAEAPPTTLPADTKPTEATGAGQALVTAPAMLCGSDCTPCCTPPKRRSIWVDAEYLLYFVKNSPIPVPLVTTGVTGGGAPGAADTLNVFGGGSNPNFGIVNGLRVNFGCWFNECETLGYEGATMFLERASTGSSAPIESPLGNFVLARPFINATTSAGGSVLVSSPGVLDGVVAARVSTRLAGGDMYGIANLWKNDTVRLDALVGARYLELNEYLQVDSLSAPAVAGGATFLGAPVPVGTALTVSDRVDALTYIYAGSLGARVRCCAGLWDLSVSGKVGLGVAHEVVFINGATTLASPTAVLNSAVGGVLAAPSNVGRYSDDHFVVVPEVNATFGFRVTSWLKVTAGYSFLYVSEAARPGPQFDFHVNPAQLPASPAFVAGTTATRPAGGVTSSDFFAHGVNLGLQLRY